MDNTLRIEQEKVAKMRIAYDLGQAWAKGLAVGDYFPGALVEGRAQTENDLDAHMFMHGALDVLEQVSISTDQDGIIRVDPFATYGRVMCPNCKVMVGRDHDLQHRGRP